MLGSRVLGVSGSPREGGNTDAAVMAGLAIAQAAGYRTEFQRLADYRIRHCKGCRGCMQIGRCAIRDDELDAAVSPWRQAGVIILGSPVYWLSPSGVLKDFMDRTHGWYRDGGLFRGRKAILLSVATEGGFEPHDAAITAWLTHYGAHAVGVAHVLARDRGDFEARPEEQEKVRQVVSKGLGL
jgi:multimeric flavodoxin WrbA